MSTNGQTIKILKRTPNTAPCLTDLDTDSKKLTKKPVKSLEEREAAYAEARKRILGASPPASPGAINVVCSSLSQTNNSPKSPVNPVDLVTTTCSVVITEATPTTAEATKATCTTIITSTSVIKLSSLIVSTTILTSSTTTKTSASTTKSSTPTTVTSSTKKSSKNNRKGKNTAEIVSTKSPNSQPLNHIERNQWALRYQNFYHSDPQQQLLKQQQHLEQLFLSQQAHNNNISNSKTQLGKINKNNKNITANNLPATLNNNNNIKPLSKIDNNNFNTLPTNFNSLSLQTSFPSNSNTRPAFSQNFFQSLPPPYPNINQQPQQYRQLNPYDLNQIPLHLHPYNNNNNYNGFNNINNNNDTKNNNNNSNIFPNQSVNSLAYYNNPLLAMQLNNNNNNINNVNNNNNLNNQDFFNYNVNNNQYNHNNNVLTNNNNNVNNNINLMNNNNNLMNNNNNLMNNNNNLMNNNNNKMNNNRYVINGHLNDPRLNLLSNKNSYNNFR